MLVVTVGEVVVVSTAFKDAANQPIAATGVAIKAKAPSGTVTAGTVAAGTGTGVFTAQFTASEPGSWSAYGECTGPSVSVSPSIRFRAVAKSF